MTIRAKLLLCASIAALSAATLSCAQENKVPVLQDAVNDHLQRVVDANTWQTGDSKPFYLKLNFELLNLAGKSEGTGTLEQWSAPHRVATKIEGSSVHVTSEGSFQPRGRNSYLISLLLQQMLQPVVMGSYLRSLKLEEADRKFGSATLHCFAMRGDAPLSTGTRFLLCTSMPGDVVRINSDYPATVVRNRIGKFRDKPVPMEVSISYDERVAIKATVVELKGIATDDSHLPLADELPAAPTIPGSLIAGSKISGVAPVYPPMAKTRHVTGTVVVAVLISKSGEIADPVVLASPDELLSEAAINALTTWKYKPYLLNGNPLEVSSTVLVNFNLQ